MLTTASILCYGNIKSVRRKIFCKHNLLRAAICLAKYILQFSCNKTFYVIFSVLKMHFLELNHFFPSTCITYIFSNIMPPYSNPIQLVLVFLALYSLWPRQQFENESVKYRWKIALIKNKRDNVYILELFGCTHFKFRSRDIIRINTSAITILGYFQTGTHCQAQTGVTAAETLCSYVSFSHNSFDGTTDSLRYLV